MQQILTPAMVVYDDLSDEFRMYENVLQAAHDLEDRHPDYLIDDFEMEWRDITVFEARDLLPPDVVKCCDGDQFLIGMRVSQFCRMYGIPIEFSLCPSANVYDVRIYSFTPKWRENSQSNYKKCLETGFWDATPHFERQMELRDSDLIAQNTIYQKQLQQQLGELNG